ncbi:MerR family DNA-binding protein, partial [Kitasatospora sp. NPDC059463]|uniref:MerR family DNA-binding protein n=1 Tax=Kitasatospora sp. NPDC059463 TaxID=3346842 RepID=UPI0036BF0D62
RGGGGGGRGASGGGVCALARARAGAGGGPRTSADRRDLLLAHREAVRQQIADLHATLAVLDHKIDVYNGRLARCAASH